MILLLCKFSDFYSLFSSSVYLRPGWHQGSSSERIRFKFEPNLANEAAPNSNKKRFAKRLSNFGSRAFQVQNFLKVQVWPKL